MNIICVLRSSARICKTRPLTLSLTLPRDHHDAVDAGLTAQVHHPDGLLHVEVVEDGAAV